MCGRLVIASRPHQYASLFGLDSSLSYAPRYNVPPTTDIYACYYNTHKQKDFSLLRWGLVPSWSNGPDPAFSMFNAKSETLTEKPAFRTAFRKQRCLIPVDGFYEWHVEDGKQPYYIHYKNNAPLVLAGLWDRWLDPQGNGVYSCTIITTTANDLMRPIHERMPVILNADSFETWLDPDNHNTTLLQDLLLPYHGEELALYKVDKRVGNARFDSEACIQSIE